MNRPTSLPPLRAHGRTLQPDLGGAVLREGEVTKPIRRTGHHTEYCDTTVTVAGHALAAAVMWLGGLAAWAGGGGPGGVGGMR